MEIGLEHSGLDRMAINQFGQADGQVRARDAIANTKFDLHSSLFG